MTPRQLSAMTLYFVAGLSFRQVGEVLGTSGTSARDLVMRGRATAIRDCSEAAAPEDAEAMLRTMLAQPERAIAADRQDDVLAAIEERIKKSDSDLAAVEDVMKGEVKQGSHMALNTFDRWELELLSERAGKGLTPSLPSSHYEARRLTRFVTSDALT